jgi:acetyltransferase-like isoleucine patch superfamily enzyme
MPRFLSSAWNSLIDAGGGLTGSVVRTGVSRGWIYFPFASEVLSVLPFSLGWKLRRAIYARLLPQIGRDVLLNFGVVLEDPRTTFGDDIWISTGCYIDYANIGSYVLVGPHSVLLSGGRHHRFDRLDLPVKHQGNWPKKPLMIGDGVWIGANATIMADVGHDAIVGAGSVVTKPVAPYAIVAGNPARVIRDRRQLQEEAAAQAINEPVTNLENTRPSEHFLSES